ncbi:MAG TPA: hypothetical protein PKA27_10840 [Fimbriimonadaceae bacterium]|nr:hypothetical protein [Fimbriimonadaceae bacterium]
MLAALVLSQAGFGGAISQLPTTPRYSRGLHAVTGKVSEAGACFAGFLEGKPFTILDLNANKVLNSEQVYLSGSDSNQMKVLTESQTFHYKDKHLYRGATNNLAVLASFDSATHIIGFGPYKGWNGMTAFAEMHPKERGENSNRLIKVQKTGKYVMKFFSKLEGNTLHLGIAETKHLSGIWEFRRFEAPLGKGKFRLEKVVPSKNPRVPAKMKFPGVYPQAVDWKNGAVIFGQGSKATLVTKTKREELPVLPGSGQVSVFAGLRGRILDWNASYSGNDASMFEFDRAAKAWKPLGPYALVGASASEKRWLLRDSKGAVSLVEFR